jgi:hypothetical protein
MYGYESSTTLTTDRLCYELQSYRQKENSVVSDDTVMYGYESSATLTTDWLPYKL